MKKPLGDLMAKEDKIMRIWDEAAKSWSSFVREGKDYYRDDLNNPAAFKMMGNVKGKRVLDLACGEGYNTRILAVKGAEVVGVDFSESMIQLARQKEAEEKLGIVYFVSDAADLKVLSSNHFDLVTCFMSLQDIEHYEEAISEVARVLKENGRFIFSIPHPCFERIVKDGESIIDWKMDPAETPADKRPLHLGIRGYFGIGKYEVQWNMKRIIKPFKTTSFHRTLTDYSQALHENGFLVSRLVEPRPTSKAVSKHRPLGKRLKIPQSIIIEAIRLDISLW